MSRRERTEKQSFAGFGRSTGTVRNGGRGGTRVAFDLRWDVVWCGEWRPPSFEDEVGEKRLQVLSDLRRGVISIISASCC